MSLPLILALLWLVAANLAGMIPSKDHHWTRAYVLIACGIPLLGWVTWSHGPVIGMILFAAGASILRWPLVFLGRWVRARLGPPR
jgi:hypothetical protein